MEKFVKDKSSLIFVGCMFLGIAIGIKLGEPGFGTMLGLGVGFILKYIMYKNNS